MLTGDISIKCVGNVLLVLNLISEMWWCHRGLSTEAAGRGCKCLEDIYWWFEVKPRRSRSLQHFKEPAAEIWNRAWCPIRNSTVSTDVSCSEPTISIRTNNEFTKWVYSFEIFIQKYHLTTIQHPPPPTHTHSAYTCMAFALQLSMELVLNT